MVNGEEKEYIKDTFFAINTSFTGQLTNQEILECFWYYGYHNMSMYDIDIILA